MNRIIIVFLLLFFSCLNNKIEQKELDFFRFEQQLFSINTENVNEKIMSFRTEHKSFNEFFEKEIMLNSKNDSLYAEELLNFIQFPQMREAYDSLSLLYSDFSDIENELNNAFSIFYSYFPQHSLPKIITFFSGFNYGVIAYDNIIAIGLENFLGKNSKFYKLLRNPNYLSFHKQKKFLTSNVMEVWYNECFDKYFYGEDFLSRLIHKGKIMLFIDLMLPNSNLENKFRFSKVEMDWVINNEDKIWTYFIENELLYSIKEQEFISYLNYAPFARGMPNKAPSRVGYYIGYRILQDYMQNNNVSLNDVVKENDYRKILKNSRYKPKK